MPNIMKMDTYPLTSTTKGGTCSFCNTSQKHDEDEASGLAPVYHLGVWIEMEGALVVCTDCAVDVGRNVGMLLESECKARKSDVNRAEKRDRAIKDVQPSALEAHSALTGFIEAMGWV